MEKTISLGNSCSDFQKQVKNCEELINKPPMDLKCFADQCSQLLISSEIIITCLGADAKTKDIQNSLIKWSSALSTSALDFVECSSFDTTVKKKILLQNLEETKSILNSCSNFCEYLPKKKKI